MAMAAARLPHLPREDHALELPRIAGTIGVRNRRVRCCASRCAVGLATLAVLRGGPLQASSPWPLRQGRRSRPAKLSAAATNSPRDEERMDILRSVVGSVISIIKGILGVLGSIPGLLGSILAKEKDFVEDIGDNIQDAADAAEAVVKAVAEVARAVEHMADAIADSAEEANEVLEEVEKKAKVIKEEVVEAIENLEETVKQVDHAAVDKSGETEVKVTIQKVIVTEGDVDKDSVEVDTTTVIVSKPADMDAQASNKSAFHTALISQVFRIWIACINHLAAALHCVWRGRPRLLLGASFLAFLFWTSGLVDPRMLLPLMLA